MLYCFIDINMLSCMNNEQRKYQHAFHHNVFVMALYWIDKAELAREETHAAVVFSVVRHSDND